MMVRQSTRIRLLGSEHQGEDMDTNTPEALAWAWILQHAPTILGISRRHTWQTGLSQDDHHQDLLVRLVEKFTTYHPERSSPS